MLTLLLAALLCTTAPPPVILPPPAPLPTAPTTRRLVLAPDAEVWLDGKPCAFADVPPGATVELLDVDGDRVTIRKLHFRSKAK